MNKWFFSIASYYLSFLFPVCVAIYGICLVLFNFPFYLIWHDFNHLLLRYYISDQNFQMQSTDQWNQLEDSRWWFNNQLASFSRLKLIQPLIWSKIKAIYFNFLNWVSSANKDCFSRPKYDHNKSLTLYQIL